MLCGVCAYVHVIYALTHFQYLFNSFYWIIFSFVLFRCKFYFLKQLYYRWNYFLMGVSYQKASFVIPYYMRSFQFARILIIQPNYCSLFLPSSKIVILQMELFCNGSIILEASFVIPYYMLSFQFVRILKIQPNYCYFF